jgi:starch phosphorylase
VLVGVPHDMPIAGYGGHTVNPLRLYSAHALEEFDIGTFQAGHHVEAFRGKLDHERISKLLYPADESDAGKELRLLQEYFFVACALRDVLHRHLEAEERLEDLPERAAIQLNDTHPALAIVELLRLFVDEHGLPLERAWELVQRTFAYTNHTLLPEALERWSQPLLERVLPRHMDLIEQINGRFLEGVVERWPGDLDRMRRMSIIEEGHPKHVRMANLAIVGSHAVNGVSELHTELIRTRLVPDFHALWPERFQNKTNGISPRRWLCKANPGLAALVTEHIGKGWECDLERLRGLEEWADDPAFQEAFRGVKRENKQRLAALVKATTGVRVDPSSLFDVHVKRLHEYKRQLLAAMHVIHLYLSIVEDGNTGRAPRTCIFAGKAAPGYFIAKLVLKLISEVARTVNADPRTEGRLRVVFVPDYRVTLAERIIPAADLSEQISTAGHEASGTGNMKLALNGALTIGTLDGANIEIRDAVGPENIYIFGLRAHEVEELRASGAHDPRRHYESNANLRRILDAIGGDRFCPGEPGVFRPIWNNLLEHGDPYLHLADFGDYALTQQRVERDFQDESSWTRRAIYNVARVGHFSSDRAIREYAAEIWGIEPVS